MKMISSEAGERLAKAKFALDAADETQEFISRCEDLRTRALDEWYDVDSDLTFVRCLGVV